MAEFSCLKGHLFLYEWNPAARMLPVDCVTERKIPFLQG